MDNVIQLKKGSQAARIYRTIPAQDRESLDDALEYIQDIPWGHGDIITKRSMPGCRGDLYVYRDDDWDIAYDLHFNPYAVEFTISVWAIDRIFSLEIP